MNNRIVRENIPVPRPDFPVIVRKTLISGPQMVFGGHFHQQFELLYIRRGRLQLCCDKSDFTLGPGQLAILNPFDIHTAYSAEGLLYYYCIILDPAFLGGGADVCTARYIQPFLQGEVRFANAAPATARCGQLLEHLVKECARQAPGFELAAKADLLHIFLELYRRAGAAPLSAAERQMRQREGERFRALFLYLEENYAQNITLEDMARTAGYSVFYFSRLFHRLTGRKPTEYLRQLRLQKALELLDGGLSVSETAMRCGFNSPNYLCKNFREESGRAPSAYRSPAR